jgi:hypothetical protein
MQSSKEILTWYNELKNQCLNYTKTIKDIQTFNQTLLKEIKDKFTIMKKRYSQIPFINNYSANGITFSQSGLFNHNNINSNINEAMENSKNNFIDTNLMKENQIRLKTPKSNLENNNFNSESNRRSHKKDKSFNDNFYKNNSPGIINLNESLNNSVISTGGKRDESVPRVDGGGSQAITKKWQKEDGFWQRVLYHYASRTG